MTEKEVTFHHVGLAVGDLDSARMVLEKVLGLSFSEPEDVDNQAVRVRFAAPGGAGSTELELVQATQDRSPTFSLLEHPIKSFIRKHGEGLHHLAFGVRELDERIDHLRAQGIRTLTDAPIRGALGRRAIFLNPLDCGGMLIELLEEEG